MRIERVLYKNLPKVAFLRIFSIINYYVNNKENKKSYEKSLNKLIAFMLFQEDYILNLKK